MLWKQFKIFLPGAQMDTIALGTTFVKIGWGWAATLSNAENNNMHTYRLYFELLGARDG